VQAGFETDSNGGTVGSILGIITGRKEIPEAWTAPLRDCLRSGVENLQSVALPHLVQATIQGMASVLGKA
jgi:ADP-ribosylglycohydrolase